MFVWLFKLYKFSLKNYLNNGEKQKKMISNELTKANQKEHINEKDKNCDFVNHEKKYFFEQYIFKMCP